MTDQTPPPAAPQPAVPPRQQDRMWASYAHLNGIYGLLPVLVMFVLFKDRDAYTKTEATEALNFQITALMAEIASWVLTLAVIGWLLVPAVYIARGIFSRLAYVESRNGFPYRYPVALRLIK